MTQSFVARPRAVEVNATTTCAELACRVFRRRRVRSAVGSGDETETARATLRRATFGSMGRGGAGVRGPGAGGRGSGAG